MVDVLEAKLKLDTTEADASDSKTKKNAEETAKIIENNKIKLMTYYSYAMHISHILMSQLSGIFEAQGESMGLQIASKGLELLSTEYSIGMTIFRGISDIKDGDWIGGTMQLAIAGLMQGVYIKQISLEHQMRVQKANLEDSKNYFRQYLT